VDHLLDPRPRHRATTRPRCQPQAQFTRNPLALASALQKIENADAPTTHIKRGAAHLCIADPLGRRLTAHEGLFADALATHPPMAKRITILRGMGYAQLKKEGGSVA